MALRNERVSFLKTENASNAMLSLNLKCRIVDFVPENVASVLRLRKIEMFIESVLKNIMSKIRISATNNIRNITGRILNYLDSKQKSIVKRTTMKLGQEISNIKTRLDMVTGVKNWYKPMVFNVLNAELLERLLRFMHIMLHSILRITIIRSCFAVGVIKGFIILGKIKNLFQEKILLMPCKIQKTLKMLQNRWVSQGKHYFVNVRSIT